MSAEPHTALTSAPGVGRRYLIDNSVWARLSLSPVVAARVIQIQCDHTICVTTAQVLEHGFSAQSPADEVETLLRTVRAEVARSLSCDAVGSPA